MCRSSGERHTVRFTITNGSPATLTSVAFPLGPAGGHRVENRTDEDVRLIFFSTKPSLDVVVYPESGKLGISTLEEGYIAMVRDAPQLDYWEGE